MKPADASSTVSFPRDAGAVCLPLIAALTFLSLGLFGYGAFRQNAPSQPVTTHTAQKKTRVKPPAGHRTVAGASDKTAAVKADLGKSDPAFALMLAGGSGLGLAALAALGLLPYLRGSHLQAAQRLLEAEHTAWNKQRGVFDTQRSASDSQRDGLIAELQATRQAQEETEHLRHGVSRQFQEFFRTLPVACFCFAANGRIIRWNEACAALYGVAASEALEGTLWETLVPPGKRGDMEAQIKRVLVGETLLDQERWDRRADGTVFPVRSSLVPIYDTDGRIIGGLSASVDQKEVKRQEAQIAALTAELQARILSQAASPPPASTRKPKAKPALETKTATEPEAAQAGDGLDAEAAFRERVHEETARAGRYHTSLSLIALDLDGFAALGADRALELLTAVVKSKIRIVDIAARSGPEGYVVLLPETGETGARVAAERMRTGLVGADPKRPLTACFGVATLTPEMSGADALLARAQEALHHAKTHGPDSVVYGKDLPDSDLPDKDGGPALKQAHSRSTKRIPWNHE